MLINKHSGCLNSYNVLPFGFSHLAIGEFFALADGAWCAIWRPNLVVNYITKVKNGVNYLSEN
jgi:hypothetical protein